MPACSLAEGSHRWVGVEVRSEPRDGGEVSTPGGGRNLVLPPPAGVLLGAKPSTGNLLSLLEGTQSGVTIAKGP